jgi:peptidoglycan-N-acetylmuramic acid deacetylase
MRKSLYLLLMFLLLLSCSACEVNESTAVADDKNTLPVIAASEAQALSSSIVEVEPASDSSDIIKVEPASDSSDIVEAEPAPETIEKKENLSEESRDWYFLRNKTHQLTEVNNEIKEILEGNQAFYVLPNEEKRIYLTFDEGYELGYTGEILDTLRDNNVKAAFFITGHYIKSQPELLKRMHSEGHLIANHTWNHPDLSQCNSEDLKEEILSVAEEYEKLTGAEMAPYIRPPMGKYSEKSLDLTRQVGYSTVFWSMAFKDWDPDDQPGAEYSYQHVIDNIHPGAVILLHAVSQSNTEALDRIIKTLKDDGYVFSTFPLPHSQATVTQTNAV